MTRTRGRPPLPPSEKKERKKYPAPLRVRLSTEFKEAERLAVVFEKRLGRDKFLSLLTMSDEEFEKIELTIIENVMF